MRLCKNDQQHSRELALFGMGGATPTEFILLKVSAIFGMVYSVSRCYCDGMELCIAS